MPLLGVTSGRMVASCFDHGATTTGGTGIAGLGAGGAGEARPRRHRHHPAHGVFSRGDRLAHLDALSGPAGAGEGGHRVSQRRKSGREDQEEEVKTRSGGQIIFRLSDLFTRGYVSFFLLPWLRFPTVLSILPILVFSPLFEQRTVAPPRSCNPLL